MFPAELYYPLYLLVVLIFSLVESSKYRYVAVDGNLNNNNERLTAFAFSIFLTLWIGCRPLSGKIFVDMANYAEMYNVFFDGTPFVFNWGTDNILFDNYFALIGSLRLGTSFFFVSISAVYFLCAFFAVRKLFPKDTLAAYLVFLGAFSTFSYATNGIKAGAAASIFLLAIAYKDNLKVCLPLLLLSLGTHHSMQLPIIMFLLTMFLRNTSIYIVAWFLCLILSLAHITFFQNLFASITDETGAVYLLSVDSAWGGKSGFRYDFVLYSAMPLVPYFLYRKKYSFSNMYQLLLNLYLGTNGIWMLCMYAEFTNRIAYLSWLMYPVVIIYPFLNEEIGPNKYLAFSRVLIAHLLFTIFMYGIYYSGFSRLF